VLRIRAYCLIALTLTLGQLAVQAQGSTSFIDLVAAEGYTTPAPVLAACLAAAPDTLTALECYHNLEVVDEVALADCQGESLASCEARVAYPVPFYPEELAETVTDVYDEIYDRYYANVWKYAFKELLKCNLLFCEGGCVAEAVARIARHAYGSLNTVYWLEIFTASLYYLNSTLWYNLPFPEFGAIILPIFSLEPKPDQYLAYAQSIDDSATGKGRGTPYSFAAPLFKNQQVPFAEAERQRGLPGLPAFEGLKDALEPATLIEYQQFGFMSVLEAYGGTELMLVVPVPCILVLPLPEVRRAFTDQLTLAEGYPLPHTEETPWVPSANPTAVLATDITKFLVLDPSPPPETSEKPLSSVLTCPPVTLADLATVDIYGDEPATLLEGLTRGATGPPVTALQFLLRDNLLGQYDETLLGEAKTLGLAIQEIGVTDVFDTATQEAVNYIQGQTNLPLSGSLDELTLGAVAAITCEGDEGDAVLALQTLLTGQGFKVEPTGLFDAATKAAVLEFQGAKGLDANGVVGSRTWAALFNQ
jgi:peptidoglycan hydrolase-like protein with peptidoglycan-binding domain